MRHVAPIGTGQKRWPVIIAWRQSSSLIKTSACTLTDSTRDGDSGHLILVIERYPSLERLLAMWNSPEFQAAKQLTVGLVDVNFVVAIEGR
jgi:uncharacterized protein DUF1330